MRLASFLRPFISHKSKLSKPHLIFLWNLKIKLRVVCRLEVALFAILQRRVSGRKRPCLLLRPSCFNRLLRLPQDFFGWGFYFPKRLIWFISGIDKIVLVLCFRSNQKKPRNRKGRCLDFCPCVGLKCLLPELSKAAVQTRRVSWKQVTLFLLENFWVLHHGFDFPKRKAKLAENPFSSEMYNWL